MQNAREAQILLCLLPANQALITATDKILRARYMEMWVTSLVDDHDRHFVPESNDRNPFPRDVTMCT
jgi:hypothetical protein